MKTLKLDCEIGYRTSEGAWYRTIGPESVSDFLATCAPGERVKIEINSPGGAVIPGMAMANSIKNSQAHVVAHVTGIAASMASVIACACHEVQMEEGSFLMIHNPWGWAEGDAEEMRKEAEVLDTMKVGIMGFYRAKFPSKSEEEISALMDEETWWTGDEALEAGFACTVIPTTVRAAACATRHHFAKIPDAAAKFLAVRDEPPAPPPAQSAAEEVSHSSFPSDGGASSEGDAGETPATTTPDAPPDAQAWESRLAGLQAAKDRELAEMSAKYKADVADMKARHEAALADLQNQLQAKAQELESAKAEASSLASKLGNAEQALAQTREQLEAEIAQHRKLASAALKQPCGTKKFPSWATAVASLGYVEACRACPELKPAPVPIKIN